MASRLILVSTVLAAIAGGVWWTTSGRNRPALKEEASRLLSQGEYQRASQLADEILATNPDSPVGWQIKATAARSLGRWPEAIEAFQNFADHAKDSQGQAEGWSSAGNLCLELADLRHAEAFFRNALKKEPSHVEALRQLSTLLLSEGRHYEAKPHLFRLLQLGNFHVDELILFGTSEEFLEDRNLLERQLENDPDNALAHLGLGALEALKGNLNTGREHLERAISANPKIPQAWATLGTILLESGDLDALTTWKQRLPPETLAFPECQFVLGVFEETSGDSAKAAGRYAEVIRAVPDHRAANSRLGSLLVRSGHPELAEPFLERSKQLDELERLLHRILLQNYELELMQRTVRLMSRLGRITEEWAWWLVLSHYHPNVAQNALKQAAALRPRATTASEFSVRSGNLPVNLDLTQLPSPPEPSVGAEHQTRATAKISFTDISKEVGLLEPYYGGFNDIDEGLWIHQGFGGGVGVCDYDQDGRPDLYFTHGGRWPQDPDPRTGNLLYRSLGSHVQNVSSLSGTSDPGLGQGIAMGDFDSDGFPDIYIANIGVNTLYRNNGDGTFTPCTDSELRKHSRWTTSCLMADLNGDGFDDLYDVNYLRGTSPFTRRCLSGTERLFRSCHPDLFVGDSDQLFLSSGDSDWKDVTSDSGVVGSTGKGLGIVAADFDQSGTLDLFVANDSTPNALLLNQRSDDSRGIPQFTDQSLIQGVSHNLRGKAEACMGVAAGDATGDGLLDLFVTNFYLETNTFYALQKGSGFVDVTDSRGLGETSQTKMGFGTQFVDLDFDGDLDLFIANGHVDNYQHLDIPWKMTPDLYENDGTGHFTPIGSEEVGEYMNQKSLGRAVARLDWNQDGFEDLIVTHLDRPPALLVNQIQTSGNFLSFRLVGTTSSRTGSGAILEVHHDDRVRVVHQTAGDGYFCSSEKKLTVGLGSQTSETKVVVRWPSGTTQEFADLVPGRTWILLENSSRAFPIR
ncbi:MAG: VCBS repeat-containing protein [Planctomycetaceae bacterium]|nr:VCBS repeat-containing protein [Planctomycetaceae bacterium]